MNKTFTVKGMHCKSCEMLIADALTEAGAKNVAASFDKATVTVDLGKLTESKAKEIIKKEGYDITGSK